MSEYKSVKKGKLLLKGEKTKSKKRKHKKQGTNEEKTDAQDIDAVQHGGWWKVKVITEITGTVAIGFGNSCYIKALDNGLFTLGVPHNEGDGPSPEEIFTAFPVNDNKIALKSGYGKYIGIDKKGVVIGRNDAVGPMEQWEPIFQDDKLAIMGNNNCFMSISDDDDVLCQSKTAGPAEYLSIRSIVERIDNTSKEIPVEEQGSITEVEINYVRKYQKFQDKKLRINKDDRSKLVIAKTEGTLHETLLDRRSKMKADRYCK